MTTIKEFVETLKIPPSPLNISRSLMPQIPTKGYDDFFKYLDENDVKYHEKMIPCKELKASQSEFNLDKVRERIGKNSTKDRPLLVSNDNYILDGHHRWLAELNGGKEKIDCIVIDLPILELINMTRNHDGVHYRDVNDNKSVVETIKSVVFEKQ